jgi:DNA-directed RNA polymerase subunit RPC12/RpoP
MTLRNDLELIQEEELKQNKWYQEIGEYYYNNCQEQAKGELKDLCNKIYTSKNQVQVYLEGDYEPGEGYFCGQCDGEVPAISSFCNHCGIQLVRSPSLEEDGKLYEEDDTSHEEIIREEEIIHEEGGAQVAVSDKNAGDGPENDTVLISDFDREEYEQSYYPHIQCSQCKDILSDEDIFCTGCGAKVILEVLEEPMDISCEQCGRKIIPGNAFCTQCGKKV